MFLRNPNPNPFSPKMEAACYFNVHLQHYTVSQSVRQESEYSCRDTPQNVVVFPHTLHMRTKSVLKTCHSCLSAVCSEHQLTDLMTWRPYQECDLGYSSGHAPQNMARFRISSGRSPCYKGSPHRGLLRSAKNFQSFTMICRKPLNFFVRHNFSKPRRDFVDKLYIQHVVGLHTVWWPNISALYTTFPRRFS
jgi:hypothetical protein